MPCKSAIAFPAQITVQHFICSAHKNAIGWLGVSYCRTILCSAGRPSSGCHSFDARKMNTSATSAGWPAGWGHVRNYGGRGRYGGRRGRAAPFLSKRPFNTRPGMRFLRGRVSYVRTAEIIRHVEGRETARRGERAGRARECFP